MARPHTSGYIPASYEWLAAVATAGLKGLESVVYMEACFQAYGLARLPAATVSPSDVARRTGKARPNVGRAIAGLIAKNLLARLPDGTLALVEDPAEWRLDESPEERAARLRYVADAPRLAKSYYRPGAAPADQADPPQPARQLSLFPDSDGSDRHSCVIQNDNTDRPGLMRGVIQTDNAPLSKLITSVIQTDNGPLSKLITDSPRAIEEPARGIENWEKGRIVCEKGRTHTNGSISPGEEEPTDAEILAAWERLKATTTDGGAA